MQNTQSQDQHARILMENDVPVDIYPLIDDVAVNGSVVIIRENRPSIRIMQEPEIDPEQERLLYEEAQELLNQPVSHWFDSPNGLVADLEAGDAQ